MNCTSQTIDEDNYNAMIKWFDKNEMQPSIFPQTGEYVNYALVQQWKEFNSSSKQEELKKINLV